MSKEMIVNENGTVSFDEQGTKDVGIAFLMGSGLYVEPNAEELFEFLKEQSVEQVCEWLEAKNGSHNTLQEIKDKYQESLTNG